MSDLPMGWGRAVFVDFGDVPWTKADVLAFIARVEEIAIEEAARKAAKGDE